MPYITVPEKAGVKSRMPEGDFRKRLGTPLDVEQIEASQEDPAIRKRFERERRRAGAAAPHHPHDHGGPQDRG